MFERYTQHARRAIFFAHHEALDRGSSYIGTEHLLIGLLHEPKTRVNKLFGLKARRDDFCKELKLPMPQSSNSMLSLIRKAGDIPLSIPSKRVLAYAAEEAGLLVSETIDTEHLLLGLLRENESSVPGVLAGAGITLDSARKRISEDFGSRGKELSAKRALTPVKALVLLMLIFGIIYLLISLATTK